MIFTNIFRTTLLFFITVGVLVAGQELMISGDSKKAVSQNYHIIEDIQNPQLSITFNKALFSKSKIGTFTNQKILVCQNGLGGSFEYTGDRNITFYIESKLSTSQTYKCSVNSKLFPKVKKSIFVKTKELQLDKYKLSRVSNNFSLSLDFNDKISFASAKNSIKLTSKSSNINYEIYPKSDSYSYHLVFKPTAKKFVVDMDSIKNVAGETMSKFSKDFDVSKNSDFFLQSYDIKEFSTAEVKYNYSNGSISLKFRYLGDILNKNIKEFVEVSPKVDFYLTKKKYSWQDDRYLNFYGDFEANTKYSVTFKRGMKFSRDGYVYEIKNDVVKEITTGDRKSFINFTKRKNYISSKAKEIIINSTNIKKSKVVVEKLIDENYRYFLNFGESYNFYNYSDIVFNKEINLNCKDNEICETKLDLSEILKSKSGVYRIKLYSNEYSYKDMFLYLSDIALSAKLYKDEILVSTSSLSSNAPIYNADIAIYDDKNRLITKGKSDYFGIFRAKSKGIASKNPHSIIVKSGNEINFLKLNSAVNDFRVTGENVNLHRIESFIYLDREIARPNDMINALFVLKDNNFKSIKNAPLKIVIRDPQNKKVLDEMVKTDEFGIVEEEIEIPNSYKTGRYKIKVTWFDKTVGYKEFSVEDFIPQKIKNSIKLNKKEYNSDENIKVEVGSRYLFGTPASGLNAEVIFSTVGKKFKSKKYKSYIFSNSNRYEDFAKINMDRVTKKVKLDKEGRANLLFSSKFKEVPSIMQGMISLTVFDDGRGVSEHKSFNIYPYSAMVGIKRLNSGYASSGSVEKFKLALVDIDGNELANQKLKVTVKRAIWHYHSGDYDVEVIDKFMQNSQDEISFTPNSSGTYIISVKDMIGGHTTSTSFYVSGWSYDPANDEETSSVKVLIENKNYKAGEQIKVGIKSPISGRMILTIEDDKIHHYEVINIKNNTAELNLQVPYGIKDSFYIKAYIVRDTKEDDRVVPFRVYGEKFVKIDKTKHKIEIKVATKKVYESKQKVSFEVDTNIKNGYVVFSVVDMGILNIIGQTPPKPFEFFLTKEYDASSIYDFYNNLLSHINKSVNKFGSGESLHKKMKKHMPPESMNKRVKPFSYYSKKVKIIDGKAKIEVDIPNFNGQARVVAIAIDENKISSIHKYIIVKDDIIVKPTYPRFLSIGDILEVPVRFFNTTKKPKTLQVSVKAKNSKVDLVKTISLKPKSSKTEYLKLIAKRTPNTYIKISAVDGTKKYFNEVDIPTKTTKSLKTFSKGGESSETVSFKIEDSVFNSGDPSVSVVVSDTVLSEFNGDFDSLIQYPYGCAEQTSSKILAMLNLGKFIDKNSKNYKQKLDKNRFMIVAGVDKLYRMQKSSGVFSYWPNGKYVNKFASIYASDVVLEAKQKGYSVPTEMVNKIKQALNTYSRYTENDTRRLYALYILSKYSKIDLALVNSIYDKKSYRSSLQERYLMAALLKKLNLTKEFNKVYDEILEQVLKDNNRRTYSGNFYSYIKNVSFSLYIHLENFKKDKMSQRLFDEMIRYIRKGELYSTQDRAFVLRALNSYYKGSTDTKLNANIEVNSEIINVQKPQTINRQLFTNLVKITPVKNSSMNYLIAISALDEFSIKDKQDTKLDLSIDTNFYTDSGNKADLNNLKVGDKIYLEIYLESKREIENVVVNCQIPSNMEIVNIRLNKEAKNSIFEPLDFKPDYIDIRDDRELVFLNVKNRVRFYIPLRAVSKGVSKMPPIMTEAMYDSRINDYSKKVGSVRVK